VLESIRHASLAVVAATTQVLAFGVNWLTPFIFASSLSISAISGIVELAAQSISLIVIISTAAYHLYHYLVKTEEDIRQEQIDAVLKRLAEKQLDRQQRGKRVSEEDKQQSE